MMSVGVFIWGGSGCFLHILFGGFLNICVIAIEGIKVTGRRIMR